jgi:hypothetical protein
MIKALLNIKKNVNITKYLKLRAFLKKQGEDYRPKKAKVLTKEEFDKFMFDASDEKYLATKVKITMFYFVLCTKSPIFLDCFIIWCFWGMSMPRTGKNEDQ